MAEQQETKTQISVAISDRLRRQLEDAARRGVRSLSGEIVFRLQRSFGRQPDSDAA
jgi:hypothetical protein